MISIAFYIYITILAISFLTSITEYFKKEKLQYLVYFPPFLLITLVVEIIGRVTAVKGINNGPLYNIFLPSEYLFYFFTLHNIIQNHRYKKYILYACTIHSIFTLTSLLLDGLYVFPTLIYSFGAILILVFCALYFYQLIELPVFPKPTQEPSFWIVCGLLIFYGGTLPIWATTNLAHNFSESVLKIEIFILMALNCILYSFFVIAFLSKVKHQNSTS